MLRTHPSEAETAGSAQGRVRSFVDALNRGDAGGAAEMFCADGTFHTPDATGLCGRGSLRAVFAQLIAARLRIEIETAGALLGADVALVWGRWSYRTGAAGVERYKRLNPRLVLRRREEQWWLAIASFWT